MTSTYDDLTGKNEAIQDFLKMIKEKNSEKGMEGILEKMSPASEKVENFLRENRPTHPWHTGGIKHYPPDDPRDRHTGGIKQYSSGFPEFLGGPKVAHDYDEDPYIRKTIMDIINTPGYDSESVKEAQRQLLRMNQGLPRFPTA